MTMTNETNNPCPHCGSVPELRQRLESSERLLGELQARLARAESQSGCADARATASNHEPVTTEPGLAERICRQGGGR